MAKRKYKTAEQRKKEVNELTDMRNNQVDKYFQSPEQMKEYFDFMSKMNFYDYSIRNSILIQKQFSGAKAVGSFKFWQDKGFPVQKGEKGIKIITPYIFKTFEREKNGNKYRTPLKYATKEEKEKIEQGKIAVKEHLSYGIGYVFDISQTNATEKDLPYIFPNKWLDGTVENYDRLKESLESLAGKMNVEILNKPLHELGSAKGAYIEFDKLNANGMMERHKGIELNTRNSELQNTKTLIHELAHAKLHNSKTENATKLNHSEKEFQAEMTAYTVCTYFNIDTSDYSLQYLHHYTKNHEDINDRMQLLEEVKETSFEFISHIENDLMKEQTKEMTENEINQHDKQLQEQFKNIDIIVDSEVKNIGDLSLEEFQEYFYDQHDRNILANMEEKNQQDAVKAFNDLSDDWSKHPINVKMIDESLTKPQAYVVWSETNLNHQLQSVEDLDKELAIKNLNSFERLGYDKTRVNLVIPKENGVSVERINRIDLGDGNYSDLKDHVKDPQPHLLKYMPENQDYLREVYSKDAVTNMMKKVYNNNLQLKSEHNIDQLEVHVSDSNVKNIEELAQKHNLLNKDEINSIKNEVSSEFAEKKEYKNTANQVVNLKGYYEQYQQYLQSENKGKLTEEKITQRMNAENKYVELKEQAIETGKVTEGILSKMEKEVSQKYNVSQKEKHQEKSSPFETKQKKNQQGLSM